MSGVTQKKRKLPDFLAGESEKPAKRANKNSNNAQAIESTVDAAPRVDAAPNAAEPAAAPLADHSHSHSNANAKAEAKAKAKAAKEASDARRVARYVRSQRESEAERMYNDGMLNGPKGKRKEKLLRKVLACHMETRLLDGPDNPNDDQQPFLLVPSQHQPPGAFPLQYQRVSVDDLDGMELTALEYLWDNRHDMEVGTGQQTAPSFATNANANTKTDTEPLVPVASDGSGDAEMKFETQPKPKAKAKPKSKPKAKPKAKDKAKKKARDDDGDYDPASESDSGFEDEADSEIPASGKKGKAKGEKKRVKLADDTTPVSEAAINAFCTGLHRTKCKGTACKKCGKYVIASKAAAKVCIPVDAIKSVDDQQTLPCYSEWRDTMTGYRMRRLIELAVRRWGSVEELAAERDRRQLNKQDRQLNPKPKKQKQQQRQQQQQGGSKKSKKKNKNRNRGGFGFGFGGQGFSAADVDEFLHELRNRPSGYGWR